MDRRWVLAAGAGVVAVLAGVWWGRGVAPAPAPTEQIAAPSTAVPQAGGGEIVVHVAGWVASPGLVSVPADARVGDAVAAAGGVRPGGAPERLNLAQPLADGQQVVVPGPGEAPAPSGGGGGGSGGGPVRLNVASAAELETLPGVGPVLAGRIVTHRDSRGGFDTVEDLLEVPGIGEAKLASLRDHVVP